MSTHPGDPGAPVNAAEVWHSIAGDPHPPMTTAELDAYLESASDPTTTAPASDHRIHQVIRALRDLGVTSPARAASVLISADGAGLTLAQRERVLAAFPPGGGWTSAGCTAT